MTIRNIEEYEDLIEEVNSGDKGAEELLELVESFDEDLRDKAQFLYQLANDGSDKDPLYEEAREALFRHTLSLINVKKHDELDLFINAVTFLPYIIKNTEALLVEILSSDFSRRQSLLEMDEIRDVKELTKILLVNAVVDGYLGRSKDYDGNDLDIFINGVLILHAYSFTEKFDDKIFCKGVILDYSKSDELTHLLANKNMKGKLSMSEFIKWLIEYDACHERPLYNR